MRAGGYTVHQSLTAEAAAVLKLSLGLARRRGHAQVTPLHVAYTLLSGASASPTLFATGTTSALRRACARSHPGGACASRYSHPAQCRALELCLNVALNRLPTANAVVGSPSSSSSASSTTSFATSILHQPSPTLSNALVAALKRAQANQRRGCVKLQAQPPSPPGPPSTSQQQQQPPMLTIKVELDQLIISILDDPSVNRVMKEAGFSSAAVKTSLEEESAAMLPGPGHHHGSSTPSPCPAPGSAIPSSQSFVDLYAGFPSGTYGGVGGLASWPAPFLNCQPAVELESPCKEEDVRAILEVMSRKQGRRTNPVVVGDSVSVAEASVAELMRRLERGDVPDELRGARVLRLHLPHVHVRHMTRADVDACVADLRRTVAAADAKAGGLVIYVGDMRWAVDGDEALAGAASGGFSPGAHLAAELSRLLGELRATSRGWRAWLVAAASYGTYMLCQQRSSLEATLALQPVAVPAGAGAGLGLSLALGPRAATRETDGKVAQQVHFPLLDFSPKEEDGVPVLCVECSRSYEIEASAVRAKAQGTDLALTFFPGWPMADKPQTSHEDDMMDLKMKWSRVCRRVHLLQRDRPARPSNAATFSNPGPSLTFGTSRIKHEDVKTTLSLLPPASAQTSDELHCHGSEDMDAVQAAEESDTVAECRDMKNVLRLWIDESSSSGDLKRKAQNAQLPRGPKRWRGSCCGLDLNLCADDEDHQDGGGVGSEDDELVPSDLTNDDGEASGDVTDSLDSSHC